MKYWAIGTFLLIFNTWTPVSMASFTSDEQTGLKVLSNINTTLSRFNLANVKSYISCGCQQLEEMSFQVAKICDEVVKVESFVEDRINYEGTYITIENSCKEKFDELLADHQVFWKRFRFFQAIENQESLPQLLNNITEFKINPTVTNAFGDKVTPLTNSEMNEVRQEIIDFYNKTEMDFLARFTTASGEESNFENMTQSEYARYNAYRKIDRDHFYLDNHKSFKDRAGSVASRILDNLPTLNYLSRLEVSHFDLIEALGQVKINAEERLRLDVETDLLLNSEDLSSDRELTKYLYLTDNSLGLLNLPILLRTELQWSEERIEKVLTSLLEKRRRHVRNQMLKEVGVSIGAISVCFIPVPQVKIAGYVFTKYILRTSCFALNGSSINTYFLFDAQERYKELTRLVLSSPNGRNLVRNSNQISGAQFEINLIKFFYLFEAIPTFELLRSTGLLQLGRF